MSQLYQCVIFGGLVKFKRHYMYLVRTEHMLWLLWNKYLVSYIIDLSYVYSWVSRDVIISLGINSKSMHSHRREIVFHCMCWPCVWQQICAISWVFFTSVQHNHQYILGWPPLRLTAKYPSETQELARQFFESQSDYV